MENKLSKIDQKIYILMCIKAFHISMSFVKSNNEICDTPARKWYSGLIVIMHKCMQPLSSISLILLHNLSWLINASIYAWMDGLWLKIYKMSYTIFLSSFWCTTTAHCLKILIYIIFLIETPHVQHMYHLRHKISK